LKALSLIIVFQANVYHATKSDGSELAIKVYKTSVLVFKWAISITWIEVVNDFVLVPIFITVMISGIEIDMYKEITVLDMATVVTILERWWRHGL